MNKYEECSYCRRVNSPLCEQCRDASLLLINDTRRFFYINREGEARRGPVEAFLLPYMNVWACSYVLELGKEKWDFAGEVLDKRTLVQNFKYCPICNNKLQMRADSVNQYDREMLHECCFCGFRFKDGGTQIFSEAQMEYLTRKQKSG